VILPARIIENSEVRKQIGTGLTVSFVARTTVVDVAGNESGGSAVISVRYDLWDENYLVTIIDVDRRRSEQRVDSYAHLIDFWTRSSLVVAHPGTTDFRGTANVKVEMLPFSAAEEADAQRWLSRSANGPAARGGEAAPESRLLEVIIGMSVQRRPLLEFHWRVAVEHA
jgi:hypothetical protein